MSAAQSTMAAPTSVTEAPAALPSGGQGTPSTGAQGLDSWIENFRKYETTLQEVTKATAETKFKAELDTIEQWYKVLNEPERTASVYTLLLHSNQDQIRFYTSVLQQMAKPEEGKPDMKAEEPTVTTPATTPVSANKLKPGARRPPTLDLPELGSPTTPTAKESAALPAADASKNRLAGLRGAPEATEQQPEGIAGLPGLGMMSPYHLNMIANAGLSKEAQLLAVQLIMSGIVQPTAPASAATTQPKGKKTALGDAKTWRTPTSAKYPGSALRTGGLRAQALKSAGLKNMGSLPSASLPSASLPSAGLQSAGLDSPSVATPREEDFKPEMLDDIPGWLRSLRLHKYNSCFEGLPWQEMVVLDDESLEKRGVAALGARRRLLRTFEFVRRRMGIDAPEDTDNITPTTSTIPKPAEINGEQTPDAKNGAAPTSKLSVTSPVFVPSFVPAPQNAAVPITTPVESDLSVKV